MEVQPLYAAQDVRKKDSKVVRKQSEFNKAEKARLLIKSKKNFAWKNYAPPEHQPGYIPVLPKLSARDPEPSSSGKSASSKAQGRPRSTTALKETDPKWFGNSTLAIMCMLK